MSHEAKPLTAQEVTRFFDQYVRGFMAHDIESANNQGANFLVALGLSIYTEVMGGLVTGALKQRGRSKSNYEAFLPFLGQYYVNLDKKVGLYDRVRCGLAHGYFIKGPNNSIVRTLVDRNGSPDNVPGILYSDPSAPLTALIDSAQPVNVPAGTIIFGTRNYFRDFMGGVEQYHDQLIREFSQAAAQQKLLPSFNKALAP